MKRRSLKFTVESKQSLTSALCCSLQTKVNKLQGADLISELEDEDFVELESLRCASRIVKKFEERVGKLVP